MANVDRFTPEQIDQTVEDWFTHHFRANALSRDVEVYNAAFEAKADLKAKLRELAAAPVIQPNDGEQAHDSSS